MVQQDDTLILSHWKDDRVAKVDKNVAVLMKNCHVDGVRFLYSCYRKKLKGAVLNQDAGMNNELQVAAFLNSFSDQKNVLSKPVLIISTEENVLSWHYHIRKYSALDLFRLNGHNGEHLFEKNDFFVILATEKDFKMLQEWNFVEFFMVVVDRLDSIVNKRLFNHLAGDFNIGLTDRNFYKNRDKKLLWSMLNWTNPEMFGKAKPFNQFDKDHLDCLADPYAEIWLRQTWACASDKPSDEQRKEYTEKIRDWAKESDLLPRSSETKPSRKRKANSGVSNKTKKQNAFIDDNDDCEEEILSSLETPPRLPNSWDSDYDSPTPVTIPKNDSLFKKAPINKFQNEKSPTTTSKKMNLFEIPKKFSPEISQNGWHIPKQSKKISDFGDFAIGRNVPRKSKSEIDEIIRRDFGGLQNDLNRSIGENSKANSKILGNIGKMFNGEDIGTSGEIETAKKNEGSFLRCLFDRSEDLFAEVFPEITSQNGSRLLKSKCKSDVGVIGTDFIDDFVVEEFSSDFLPSKTQRSAKKFQNKTKSDSWLLKEHIDDDVFKEFSKEFQTEEEEIGVKDVLEAEKEIVETIKEANFTQQERISNGIEDEENISIGASEDFNLVVEATEDLLDATIDIQAAVKAESSSEEELQILTEPIETIEILDDNSKGSTKEDNSTLLEIINGSSANLCRSPPTTQESEEVSSSDDNTCLTRLVFSNRKPRYRRSSKTPNIKKQVSIKDAYSDGDDFLTSFLSDRLDDSDSCDIFESLLTGRILN